MTLNCNIGLETPSLSHVFCTPSRQKEHLGEVKWKSFKGFRKYGADRKSKGVNPMTLKVDLDLESADPAHGFCTPSHWEGHLGEVNYKSFKGFRRYWAGTKLKDKSQNIEVWPWPWVKFNENRSNSPLKLLYRHNIWNYHSWKNYKWSNTATFYIF